jgi:outer membrane protein OmpA-like peptidoglycan-associated protein
MGLQYYVVPDVVETFDFSLAERYGVSNGFIKPLPGFRAGAGYQWRNLRFFLEAGYTQIKGENPLVLNIDIVPLVLKGGYVFSFRDRFTVTPVLGAGLVFVEVDHYETAIGMLLDDLSRSSTTSFFAHAALRFGWSFVPALALYAGAGVDCLFETDGLIPLPALEVGFTLKPFLFGKKFAGRAEPVVISEDAGVIPVPPLFVPEAGPEEESVVAAEEPEPPPRIIKTVYFPADADVSFSMDELDAAAALLLSDPSLSAIFRGYTAPYSTPGARQILSEVRARFCAEYLMREYGIAPERITIEWYGSEKLPENSDDSDERRRCVEIIIESVTDDRGIL